MHVFALPLNKSSKYPFQTYSKLVNKICVLILLLVLLLFIYLTKSKHVINSVSVDEKRQDSFLITFHKAFTPLLNRWQYVITQAVEKKDICLIASDTFFRDTPFFLFPVLFLTICCSYSWSDMSFSHTAQQETSVPVWNVAIQDTCRGGESSGGIRRREEMTAKKKKKTPPPQKGALITPKW